MHNFNKQIQLLEMAYGLGEAGTPITIQGLIDLIKEYDASGKGAQPISFTSVTSPQYRKTGFPYKSLYKVGQTAGMLGTNYGGPEGNVNAQRAREGKPTDFVSGENKNIREWLSKSIGITVKGLTVVKYRPLNSQPSLFVVEDNIGRLQEIPRDEAKKYLFAPAPSASQGLDQEIDYRLYGLDKLVAVNFQKQEYVITNADPKRLNIFNLVSDKLKT